jgi:hypothetical protein
MIKRGLTPEEFNKFLNQKLDDDKIELFYRANFINPLKAELFHDFTISLLDTIHASYPGDDVSPDGYYFNHFKFCFDKVIKNFSIEQLFFNGDGKEVSEYFYLTLEETYYKDQNKEKTIFALKNLYNKIFDMENMNKTQSDMDIFLDIYKSFLKLFIKKSHEATTNINK